MVSRFYVSQGQSCVKTGWHTWRPTGIPACSGTYQGLIQRGRKSQSEGGLTSCHRLLTRDLVTKASSSLQLDHNLRSKGSSEVGSYWIKALVLACSRIEYDVFTRAKAWSRRAYGCLVNAPSVNVAHGTKFKGVRPLD